MQSFKARAFFKKAAKQRKPKTWTKTQHNIWKKVAKALRQKLKKEGE